MHPIDQLNHVLPADIALCERIAPDQLDEPTPCTEFSVHDVLNHMITLGGAFAYLFRGQEPPPSEPVPRNGQVPVSAFTAAMQDLLDAVQSPGAMERTIEAPVGTMPGETFARLVAFDGLIHGWDLSRSTGQPYQPDEDVVAAVDAFARQALTDDMRDGDTFAAPTSAPEDATRLERLVAFSGRTL